MSEKNPEQAIDQERAVRAVGEITIAWSTLEYTLNELYDSFFSELDNSLHEITRNELGLRRIVTACKHMAFCNIAGDLNTLSQKCLNLIDNELRPIRNEYVHGYFDLTDFNKTRFNKNRIIKTPFKEPFLSITGTRIGMIENVIYPSMAIRRMALSIYRIAIIMHGDLTKKEEEELTNGIQFCLEEANEAIATYKSKIKSE